MALSLQLNPSVPMLAPADFTPSVSVSALDILPDVPFGNQVTVTRTTISGDTTTLDEGTDYSYNGVTDEVFFFIPLSNDDVISFSITPDYSVSDLSTQFSDLGAAPAEGSNLRDKQLLQMARDLDSRILALGGQASGGGTSAGVSSLVVGSSSYDGTIQLFAGTGLSFLEGSNSFQIQLDSNIVAAPGNIATLNNEVSTLDSDLSSLAATVGNIYQVPDSSAATVGHVLTVNNSNQAEWQAPTGGSGGGGGATNISGLDDVTINSLTDGDILVASGGDFVNQAPNFLTSGDVSAVALDNDYNSLTNLPTLPTTTGSWGLVTDRANITLNAPANETLASGYVWRWTGSQFKPARLDIADVNTAGNQPLTDLMDGTTEAVPEYVVGDADKVLTVSSAGTGLEWATPAAASSGGGLEFWQGDFGVVQDFDGQHSTPQNATLPPVQLTNASLGTYSTDGSTPTFSVTDAGYYKVTATFHYFSTSVELEKSFQLVHNGTVLTNAGTSLRNNSTNQDAAQTVTTSVYVQCAASDVLTITGNLTRGNWIIEKVG